MNQMQRAAVLTALQKAVKQALDKVRGEADAELVDLYDESGADRVKVRLGDEQIATFSVTFDKPGYVVVDKEAFEAFLLRNGMATEACGIREAYIDEAVKLMQRKCPEAIETTVRMRPGFEDLIVNKGGTVVVEGTGEVVPGVEPVPGKVKGTRLTGCDPEKVLPVLQQLPGGVAQVLALEGEQ